MKINLSKLKSSKLVVSNFIKEIYRDLKMRAVRNRRRRDAVAEQRPLEERTLIVDDVHLLADETILKYIFQEIGEIRLIYYPTQKTDSVTAYVIYEDPSLAHFALRICNNIELFKQKIKVSSLIYKRDTSYDWLDDPAHDDVQSTSEYIKSHIAFKAMSYELKLWADSICELALRGKLTQRHKPPAEPNVESLSLVEITGDVNPHDLDVPKPDDHINTEEEKLSEKIFLEDPRL